MSDKLMEMLPDKVVHSVGRDESASPATGSFTLHQIEEQELVTQALGARSTSGAVARQAACVIWTYAAILRDSPGTLTCAAVRLIKG